MYFFQDDIGLLIQHAKYNIWQWLITPQAEHFAPLLHLLTYFEFKLFNLNFYGYFFVSLILHFLNLLILYKTLRLLKLHKHLSLIVLSLFTVNLTFVEPLLWFSAQGVILTNIFIALTFYFWLKNSPLIFVSLIMASFSYSTGLGLGIIFGFIDLLKGRTNLYFFLIGFISIILGPLIAGSALGQISPVIRNPVADFLLFSAFVIGGVGRGVIGRLFLPGFEPRHFEIIKTILSFIPLALITGLIIYLRKKVPKKLMILLLSLSVLIVYSYVWAGAIRYQFGIKQALAERYAYTPLFFTVILFGLLLKYFFDKKILNSYKIISFSVLIILIFQIINFHKKAVEFEIRPLRTKKYIEDLKMRIKTGQQVKDGPLPEFINQPLKVSDLYPILYLH